MRIEYEMSLNNTNMHIFTEQPYEEDYQIQMLRQNKIAGILAVEGCEIEGKSRYTYEITGLTSMQKLYEKKGMKKDELKNFLKILLDTIERVQKYMLEPNNLILHPECIFRKNEQWYFCYLPGKTEKTGDRFHQLSEYFVRTVDYKDTEAILLAYELHKASFQENYSLKQVLDEYEKNGIKRDMELEELRKKQKIHENIFSLTEEETQNHTETKKPPFFYNLNPATNAIREDDGVHSYQVKSKKLRSREKERWGLWDDLIKESDD